MSLNPYQTPANVSRPTSDRETHWYYSVVAPLSASAFWIGVILGVLGSTITFLPGGEAYWFAFTSVFFACGLFAKGNRYRVAAAILLVLCLMATYNGWIRGIEYQELLRARSNFNQ